MHRILRISYKFDLMYIYIILCMYLVTTVVLGYQRGLVYSLV